MNTWLFGGAAVAAVTMAWNYIRTSISYVTSFVVMQASLKEELSEAVLSYLLERSRYSKWGPRQFMGTWFPMKKTGDREFHLCEVVKDGKLFWYGWCPIWVSESSGGEEIATGSKHLHSHQASATLIYLRFLLDIEQFLKQARVEFVQKLKSQKVDNQYSTPRFLVRVLAGHTRRRNQFDNGPTEVSAGLVPAAVTHWGTSYSYDFMTCRREEVGEAAELTMNIDQMAICSDSAEELISRVDYWFHGREWYRERQIPWKIGAYLHGPPGTGKTSLIRAIAKKYDMPVYVFDLSTMSNQELRAFWDDVRQQAPAVILFEDFHLVFDRERNVLEGSELSLDAIYQCLSGVDETSGVFVTLTTNSVDSLTPALTRAGRFEYSVEMPLLNLKGATKIAERILRDEMKAWKLVANLQNEWRESSKLHEVGLVDSAGSLSLHEGKVPALDPCFISGAEVQKRAQEAALTAREKEIAERIRSA